MNYRSLAANLVLHCSVIVLRNSPKAANCVKGSFASWSITTAAPFKTAHPHPIRRKQMA
jgi:hypothetical protein